MNCPMGDYPLYLRQAIADQNMAPHADEGDLIANEMRWEDEQMEEHLDGSSHEQQR